jgi:hypothetical protein
VTQCSPQQRGHCPVCKRLVTLTADGKVPRHNDTPSGPTPRLRIAQAVDTKRKPQLMSDSEAVPAVLVASYPDLPPTGAPADGEGSRSVAFGVGRHAETGYRVWDRRCDHDVT